MFVRCTLLLSLLVALGGCDPSSSSPTRDGGGTTDGDIDLPTSDADGDGIDDSYEGRGMNTDTDGDGTPDYRDTDSDNDGFPDSEERGTGGASSPPEDTDSDGIPDFQDTDADGNGIPDAVEGDGDTDADGRPDYRDTDDDGDTLLDSVEIGGDPSAPVDFDGDGLPDFRDIDSDDDTISDRHEAIGDTDMDGVDDRFDLDSDGDGWSDREEAGDDDPLTVPVDTDGDLKPDFRDADSDGDGLSDADERTYGTARDNADTDGDGVTDLVEIGACGGDPSCVNDATDPMSSPRTRGDFVFFEPFEEAPDPPRDTLDFATDIQIADVYFLIDTTGSMGTAISNVRSSLSTAGGIIASIQSTIPDVQFGVGEYRDFGDGYVYRNRQEITTDVALAQAAVNGLSASGGGDFEEGGVAAMFSTITGIGLSSAGGYGNAVCPATNFGYPCFRRGAVPIIVFIADAPLHNGPSGGSNYPYIDNSGVAVTYARTRDALNAENAKVVGVAVELGGSYHSQADLEAFARDTGATDLGGNPLVSRAAGGSVGAGVVTQVQSLAASVAFDISVEFEDDTSDGVASFAAFVDHIEANTTGDAARGCEARAAEDTNGDGFPDTFRDVRGDRVCFDIVVKQNDTVMPTEMPQVFGATVRVVGDGFTELDSREVYFLVPPEIRDPGIPL